MKIYTTYKKNNGDLVELESISQIGVFMAIFGLAKRMQKRMSLKSFLTASFAILHCLAVRYGKEAELVLIVAECLSPSHRESDLSLLQVLELGGDELSGKGNKDDE